MPPKEPLEAVQGGVLRGNRRHKQGQGQTTQAKNHAAGTAGTAKPTRTDEHILCARPRARYTGARAEQPGRLGAPLSRMPGASRPQTSTGQGLETAEPLEGQEEHNAD